jgi:TonB-linked SusC/RagA family outer membrane protein
MIRYTTIFCLFWCLKLTGQTTITGRITAEDGRELPGSTVRLVLANIFAISDSEGNFKITLAGDSDTLMITHIGYFPTRIAVSNTSTKHLDVRLSPDKSELEEVIVSTGYQLLPAERVTGSFEKINTSLITRGVSNDIVSRLEGITSLYFDNRTGGRKLSLRGRSTIMAGADPLIIVDGFVYESDLETLNPNDVESITLLKDAAAASIWGVRSANGVIVIETKKGKKVAKPTFDFRGNFTFGKKPDLYYAPSMASSDFIEVEKYLFDKGYYNSTLNNIRFPVVTPVVELLAAQRDGIITAEETSSRLLELASFDVRQDLENYFYRNSYSQQYSAAYRGGNELYSFYFAAGWDQDLSYLQGNENNRFSLTSSNSLRLTKNLNFQTLISYTHTHSVSNSPIFNLSPTSRTLYPYAILIGEGGKALPLEKDYRQAFIDTVGKGLLYDWNYRPLDELNLADNHYKKLNLRFNNSLTYHVFAGLSTELKYQYETQIDRSRFHYSPETYLARNIVNLYSQVKGNNVVYGLPTGGILDLTNNQLSAHTARAQINYTHDWNQKHAIAVLSGSEVRQTTFLSNSNRTYGYNNNTLVFGSVNYADLLPTYNNIGGNQRIPNPSNFSHTILRFTSFFANGSYTYNDCYSISLSARKDASNLFGVRSNHRSVPLWSIGMMWNLSKKTYFDRTVIDLLKLRLTYGYNGNIDNTVSALTTVAYFSNAALTGLDYSAIRNPGNPNLRWERSGMLNAGFDFSLKTGKIYGSLDFYNKRGLDLLGNSPIDPTTGVTNTSGEFAFKGNVAQMKGSGVDVALHSNISSGSWKWKADLIYGYAFNKVLRYESTSSVASAFVGSGNLISPVEGKPVFAIFSYQWAGLDPLTGDPQGFLEGQVSKNYTAIRNSNPSTLIYHGSAVPLHFGSIRNTLSYKNVSISANLIYKLGYYFRRSSINYGSLFSSWQHHVEYAQRWQEPGDELTTNVPSMIYPNVSNRDAFYNYSEILVERGDHIRLQDVNLMYDLPASGNRKAWQFYFYMNRLGLLWKANKSGLDPDYYSGGFPLPPQYSIGFKLSF